MTIKPTSDQVEERLETVSDQLRSVMFSMKTINLGREVAKAHGLTDEDTSFLSQVVGWVLMGFLHSSGTAQAIEDYVGVDTETAKAVAQELNEKLFSKYAADLEKIYTPMSSTAAKIIDISAPIPMKTSNISAPAPMPMAPTPVSDLKPAPASIPNQAWQPTRLTVPSAPTPPAPAAPITSVTPTVPPIGAPAKPATPVVPAPFMMHQESSVAPLATGVDFKLNIPKDMFKSTPAKPIEIPRPPKMAELEIGKAPLPPKPASPTSFRITPPSQARVVHYADLRTNITTGLSAAKPEQAMPIAPKPVAPTPIAQAPSIPTTTPAINTSPTPPAAPKVVNFGPEEVK